MAQETRRNAPRPGGEVKPPTVPPWIIITLLVLPLLLIPMWGASKGETVSYSEFKALLVARKVDSLKIGTTRITGLLHVAGTAAVIGEARARELTQGAKGAATQAFTTVRVDDESLVRDLQAAGVTYAGQVESSYLTSLLGWILPLAFLFFLWRMLLRGSGAAGVMAIGKSQAKLFVETSTGVTFDDVAGIDEARADLMEIVDFLKNPERYRRLGGKIPKGVLLVGAPGTGKTLLAKALAGEADVPFLSLSGSDFVELFVGVGAARVRDLFTQAKQHAPSIIFIDELDALGRARSAASAFGGHEEREQTLNQLLAEMDGFDTRSGVIILAATNRPEVLDPALLRPGRFDRKVILDRPDVRGREQILRVHTRNVTLAPDVDLTGIAGRTPGFVGADLANLVNEAALSAARKNKAAVEAVDFEDAIDRVIAGLERKSRVITAKEKTIVAYHEAGHAIVAERRPTSDRVARISVIPRGIGALGYTRQQPTEDRYLLTHGELLDRLDVMLGGRTAEEVVFGEDSTGAHDDLQRATDLAREMVTRYGMSKALGLAAFERPTRALFLDVEATGRAEYSEETARTIDAEIRRLLDESHERVRQTLVAERAALERVAQALITREVMDREEFVRVLAATGGAPTEEVARAGAGAAAS
ncbi:MAG TPA: ATP-dependent zinc metalloprotease FtsH [Gemmatimonadaceae bacterium]|nr:ATP-dependent zinc metalloprotease FtsH [Gemmatimonadaceae bacterium]